MTTLQNDWEEVECDELKYYWNTETGEVRWQPPIELGQYFQAKIKEDVPKATINYENVDPISVSANDSNHGSHYEDIDLLSINTIQGDISINNQSQYENVDLLDSSNPISILHSFNSNASEMSPSDKDNSINPIIQSPERMLNELVCIFIA